MVQITTPAPRDPHTHNETTPLLLLNSALNYAYGVLEGECRRAINAVGLEPSVGFLHEFADYQTKQSLVYDLEEPFRWIADVAVVEAFESGVVDLPDFYFTGDDYRYRFETQTKRRFLDLLKERFNGGVKYGGHVMKWDTVIERKAIELGRFLVGRSPKLDFSDPSPSLMTNEQELRSKVIALASSEARRLGIGKSTLHYLRKRARDQKPFTIYEPVLAKLRD
jgi:CRISPR-associated protein Cas1